MSQKRTKKKKVECYVDTAIEETGVVFCCNSDHNDTHIHTTDIFEIATLLRQIRMEVGDITVYYPDVALKNMFDLLNEMEIGAMYYLGTKEDVTELAA